MSTNFFYTKNLNKVDHNKKKGWKKCTFGQQFWSECGFDARPPDYYGTFFKIYDILNFTKYFFHISWRKKKSYVSYKATHLIKYFAWCCYQFVNSRVIEKKILSFRETRLWKKLENFDGHLLSEDDHSYWVPPYWNITK